MHCILGTRHFLSLVPISFSTLRHCFVSLFDSPKNLIGRSARFNSYEMKNIFTYIAPEIFPQTIGCPSGSGIHTSTGATCKCDQRILFEQGFVKI